MGNPTGTAGAHPNRLREHRERLGLTQAQVGELIGKSKHYVHKLESGKHSLSDDVLDQLSKALCINRWDLLFEDDDEYIRVFLLSVYDRLDPDRQHRLREIARDMMVAQERS